MWLLPSLNRTKLLERFMKSAIETKTSTPGIVIIDKDDYLKNDEDYRTMESVLFPKNWKIHITDAVGMGPKVREVWDRVKDCDWVGILNDDHVCITPEWDVRLVKQLNGINFLTCDDNWNAPARAAGATVFSMPLMRAMGFPMFPPQVDHLGIDDVFESIGRATGCWDIDMAVTVEHKHAYRALKSMDDFKLVDDTHAKTYGRGPWGGSPQAQECEQRLKSFFEGEFKDVVNRVNHHIETYVAPVPINPS